MASIAAAIYRARYSDKSCTQSAYAVAQRHGIPDKIFPESAKVTLMPSQTVLSIAVPRRGSYNITDKVAHAVEESRVQTGIAHVFVQHTSCSLTITENADPDVRRDLETILSRLAPDGDPATHE